MGFKLMNGEVDLVHFTVVPVAHLVEVDEAHVVGINVAHLLPLHFDPAANVVLSLELVGAWLVLALNAVCFVCKYDLTRLLVTHFAHEQVEENVTLVVESNFLPVLEGDFFETLGYQGG